MLATIALCLYALVALLCTPRGRRVRRAVEGWNRAAKVRAAGPGGRGTCPSTLWRSSLHPWFAERSEPLAWLTDADGRPQATRCALLSAREALPRGAQACDNCAHWAMQGRADAERLHAAICHVAFSYRETDGRKDRCLSTTTSAAIAVCRTVASRLARARFVGPQGPRHRVQDWCDAFLAHCAAHVPGGHCRFLQEQAAADGFGLSGFSTWCLGPWDRDAGDKAAYWGDRLQARVLPR